MQFDEWLEIGWTNKWIGPPVCSTHDGPPMSEEEDQQFCEGEDPCIFVMRMYESPEQAANVVASHPPSQWRASNRGLRDDS